MTSNFVAICTASTPFAMRSRSPTAAALKPGLKPHITVSKDGSCSGSKTPGIRWYRLKGRLLFWFKNTGDTIVRWGRSTRYCPPSYCAAAAVKHTTHTTSPKQGATCTGPCTGTGTVRAVQHNAQTPDPQRPKLEAARSKHRRRTSRTTSNAPVTTPEPRDARVHKPPLHTTHPQARWW